MVSVTESLQQVKNMTREIHSILHKPCRAESVLCTPASLLPLSSHSAPCFLLTPPTPGLVLLQDCHVSCAQLSICSCMLVPISATLFSQESHKYLFIVVH